MKKKYALILGDVIAIAIITVIGFASHNTAQLSNVPRMFSTFVPLLIAWFLIAPWLGLFAMETAITPRKLWRVPLAMLLATPMAVILRAAWLEGVALPLFALILGLSAALVMLGWRVLMMVLINKSNQR